MKIKEKKETQSKTKEELHMLLKEVRAYLFSLRMEHSLRKLKDTASINKKRKEIAQILTYLSQKEEQV